jgi:hypothetical protein
VSLNTQLPLGDPMTAALLRKLVPKYLAPLDVPVRSPAVLALRRKLAR